MPTHITPHAPKAKAKQNTKVPEERCSPNHKPSKGQDQNTEMHILLYGAFISAFHFNEQEGASLVHSGNEGALSKSKQQAHAHHTTRRVGAYQYRMHLCTVVVLWNRGSEVPMPVNTHGNASKLCILPWSTQSQHKQKYFSIQTKLYMSNASANVNAKL